MKIFSFSQKRMYHDDRALHPTKFGISFNSPKHFYSIGFYDGFKGFFDDSKVIRKLYGKKCAFAYNMGRKNGLKNSY